MSDYTRIVDEGSSPRHPNIRTAFDAGSPAVAGCFAFPRIYKVTGTCETDLKSDAFAPYTLHCYQERDESAGHLRGKQKENLSVLRALCGEKKKRSDQLHVNQVTESIIGAAIEVHRALGPGLLESAYEECLSHELSLRQIPFQRQYPLPVEYKGRHLDCGYRLDLLVADAVVVELKALKRLLPIHEAQLLTYLKLGGWEVGLLINFNVPVLKRGIRRRVLGLEEK